MDTMEANVPMQQVAPLSRFDIFNEPQQSHITVTSQRRVKEQVNNEMIRSSAIFRNASNS